MKYLLFKMYITKCKNKKQQQQQKFITDIVRLIGIFFNVQGKMMNQNMRVSTRLLVSVPGTIIGLLNKTYPSWFRIKRVIVRTWWKIFSKSLPSVHVVEKTQGRSMSNHFKNQKRRLVDLSWLTLEGVANKSRFVRYAVRNDLNFVSLLSMPFESKLWQRHFSTHKKEKLQMQNIFKNFFFHARPMNNTFWKFLHDL